MFVRQAAKFASVQPENVMPFVHNVRVIAWKLTVPVVAANQPPHPRLIWYNLVMILPPSVRRYFWDIDTKKANPKKHARYYVDRLLEMGDRKSVVWLKKMFGLQKVKHSLSSSKISKKSKNYWQLVFS